MTEILEKKFKFLHDEDDDTDNNRALTILDVFFKKKAELKIHNQMSYTYTVHGQIFLYENWQL